MTTTLVLPDAISRVLHRITRLEVETAGILLVRVVRGSNGHLRLLAREFIAVPHGCYLRREPNELLITSEGFVPALGRAQESLAQPIWLHTHPGEGSSPQPSSHDKAVDLLLAEPFRIRTDCEFYGSMIVSHANSRLRFTGHLESENHRIEIDRVLTVGARVELAWNEHAERHRLSPAFDRNVRAFGAGVQRALQDLTVALVGCGGTGSSVAEQLVRLGVRRFILIDPDNISATNLTRTYGARAEDVALPKVDSLANHLQRIAPDVDILRLRSAITLQASARELIGADITFGCTDDNAGRLVLSRLATYMLMPVIDLGVLLTSDSEGNLDGIHGRVTLLYPGAACLVCRGRIDLSRARSEMLTPGERRRRVDEGYAPSLPGAEPAVVAYTTAVAALAVAELLERLIGYGLEPPPSEVLLRLHDRELSANRELPHAGHYCDPMAGKLGIGVTNPFLDQLWPG